MAITPSGGGDDPETGYQLVIENMQRNEPGTDARPNVEIIITDAPEKQPERLGELTALAARKKTRVFRIDTSTDPVTREELTSTTAATQ